jgi:hypothetical protein
MNTEILSWMASDIWPIAPRTASHYTLLPTLQLPNGNKHPPLSLQTSKKTRNLPYTFHGPSTVVHLRSMTGIRQGVTIVIFINTYVDQKDLSTYPIQNDSRLLHDGIGRNLKSDVIRHL